MLGREGLVIQGYPVALVPCLVEKTAEVTMMGIAGNMMASTVPLAIVMAAVAALPWANCTQPFSPQRKTNVMMHLRSLTWCMVRQVLLQARLPTHPGTRRGARLCSFDGQRSFFRCCYSLQVGHWPCTQMQAVTHVGGHGDEDKPWM